MKKEHFKIGDKVIVKEIALSFLFDNRYYTTKSLAGMQGTVIRTSFPCIYVEFDKDKLPKIEHIETNNYTVCYRSGSRDKFIMVFPVKGLLLLHEPLENDELFLLM